MRKNKFPKSFKVDLSLASLEQFRKDKNIEKPIREMNFEEMDRLRIAKLHSALDNLERESKIFEKGLRKGNKGATLYEVG